MIEDIEFTLSLIRHGESEVNATPDVLGQRHDTKLTKRGEEQAKKLGLRLFKRKEKFDYVYSSTYHRALNTAILASPKDQKIILVPDIREYDAGDWTGNSRSATMTDLVKLKMNYLNQTFLPPNGESFNMVERRASAWLDKEILYNPEMIAHSQKKKTQGEPPLNIACFSHGMTIKCLLHYIVGFDKSFAWKIQIDNTSVTRLSFSQEGWRLLNINDCFHLEV